MGVTRQLAELIFREHAHKPLPEAITTIGRLNVEMTPGEALDLSHSLGCTPKKHRVADLELADPRVRSGHGRISDKAFFSLMGRHDLTPIDLSDYEGAVIAHDLNKPLPTTLHGRFDFVVDGGTLDNVFDPANALRSLASMVSDGGRLVSTNMASNHQTPYVVFNPIWFLDYFCVNQFQECHVYFVVFQDDRSWNVFTYDLDYLASGPARLPNIESPHRTLVMFLAEKGPQSTTDVAPIQWQYRSEADRELYARYLAGMIQGDRPDLVCSNSDRFLETVPQGYRFVPCGEDLGAQTTTLIWSFAPPTVSSGGSTASAADIENSHRRREGSPNNSRPMKFHFSIAAWGEAFLDVLCRIHLPSLLAPGNLPAFLDMFPLEYRLYTTPEDAETLSGMRGFRDFSRVVPTQIIAVPGLDFSDVHHSHRVFNELMSMAMRDAEDEGASLFMNNPDTCWGDGSFGHVGRLIQQGKRGILNSAIRLDSRAFMRKVEDDYSLTPDGALIIANRELVRLGWETIHPYQCSTVWGQGNTSLMPSPIITPVEDEGYILNMAHMGSLCVISDNLNQDFQQTTDGDYINRVFPCYEDLHVLDDTDDFCVMELSDPERYINNVVAGEPLNEQHVAEYLLTTASWETHSLRNFRRCLRYHWSDVDDARWRTVEGQVEERNEAILNRRQLLSCVEPLAGEPGYGAFASVLRRLLQDPSLLHNAAPMCRRMLIVPAPDDLRRAMKRLGALSQPAAPLEALIRSHVVDLPKEPPTDGDATVHALDGREACLTLAGSGPGGRVAAVEGLPAERQLDLEDISLLLMCPGYAPAMPDSAPGPHQPAQSVAIRRATADQRRLIADALWKSVAAAGSTEQRLRFVARYAWRPGYGRRFFSLFRRLEGNLSAGRSLVSTVARAAGLGPRRSAVEPFLQTPDGQAALRYLHEAYPQSRDGRMTPGDWGKVTNALHFASGACDDQFLRGQFTDAAAPRPDTPSGDELLNAALVAASRAVSEAFIDLAQNSQIYYKMGLLLYSKKLLLEAAACFSACAFLSPGFMPAVQMLSMAEELVLGRDLVLRYLLNND